MMTGILKDENEILILDSKSSTIIIDKKSQRVIIKSKPEEIPFSDINFIGIGFSTNGRSDVDDLYDYLWYIYLSTNKGYPWIYSTSTESEAVKIAEKIGKLTGKDIKGLSMSTSSWLSYMRAW